jgi:hypothetical protein
MDVRSATGRYESWLNGATRVVKADLAVKHERMTEDAFSFLRATFYRWAQIFPSVCAELVRAPQVLGVGDLHVENYGTWRDTEGRLVWGINDFDEACPVPYTNDLVRLATSAHLAIGSDHLAVTRRGACNAILTGYTEGLKAGGRPFVLSEHNPWLRDAVTSRLRDPALYWEKLAALPTATNVPASVRSLLRRAMPEAGLEFRIAHRQAGLGSLGRQRFTAIGDWRGGKVAREAKTLLPSAWRWAGGPDRGGRIYYEEIVHRAVRAQDPFLQRRGRWILRRLSPYCSRIELHQIPEGRDEEKLVRAMGYELANVHLGTRPAVARIRSDLRRRESNWLHRAAETMSEATLKDWKEWRKGRE